MMSNSSGSVSIILPKYLAVGDLRNNNCGLRPRPFLLTSCAQAAIGTLSTSMFCLV